VAALIQLKNLSFAYQGVDSQILKRVNLQFEQGEFALICGPTGSGKSTLLATMNGLVPHFTTGRLSGQILVAGQDLTGAKPRDFAHLVGYVNQGPEAAFVAFTVAEELAFGMEQLGVEPNEMLLRVKSVAKQFGIEHLLGRPLDQLSGGQQQRVAIAAALAAGQKVLLLDEPTSALDPAAASELLSLLKQLTRDQGLTILIVEHRIERVLDLVDSVTVVSGDGSAIKALRTDGLDPVLRNYRMVPPVLELGQLLNWTPLPLSIETAKERWVKTGVVVKPLPLVAPEQPLLTVAQLEVSYGQQVALQDFSLTVFAGQVTALLGPNGSGKTSALMGIHGFLPATGQVVLNIAQRQPQSYKPKELATQLVMVPQSASDLLMLGSISAELAAADTAAEVPSGTAARLFVGLAGRIDPARHPRDLSAGQQLALVLAVQLCKGAQVILLDEPTRGLDYQAKRVLAEQLTELKHQGRAVLLASNDVEFVALLADQVVIMNNGQISTAGNAQQILPGLRDHAPQLTQVTGSAIRISQVVMP